MNDKERVREFVIKLIQAEKQGYPTDKMIVHAVPLENAWIAAVVCFPSDKVRWTISFRPNITVSGESVAAKRKDGNDDWDLLVAYENTTLRLRAEYRHFRKFSDAVSCAESVSQALINGTSVVRFVEKRSDK